MDAPLVPDTMSPGMQNATKWSGYVILSVVALGAVMVIVAGIGLAPSFDSNFAVLLAGICLLILLGTTITLLRWAQNERFDKAFRYLAYAQMMTMLVASCCFIAFFFTKVPDTYSVGGSVSNVVGSGLQLTMGGQTLSVPQCSGTSGCCGFQFPAPVEDGTQFSIAISGQPSNACSLTAGAGTQTVNGGNYVGVKVTCVTSYNVGGTIDGLTEDGLLLQLTVNDQPQSQQAPTAGATSFQFTNVPEGVAWAVTVAESPEGQVCLIATGTGSGTDLKTDISDVRVVCS